MVRTTHNSLRAQAAAQAREFAARRATATPQGSPPRQNSTPAPDQPDPVDHGLYDDPPIPEGDAGNPGGGDGGGDDGPSDDDNDDEDFNPDQDTSGSDSEAPNLASAINKLAKSVRRPTDSKAKVSEPDTFDGQDPKKLRVFRVQCELNFRDRPKAFRTDKSKVTYGLSYLRGAALEWFEPSILEGRHEDWEDDYQNFLDELQTNFGPFDPVGDAETELENLRMHDNQRYAKFTIIFNRHSSQVDWNDNALRHAFYRALPARIKDEMSRLQRPPTLNGLKLLARQLDSRYWRRQEEIKRENRSKPSTSQEKSNNNKSSKNTNTTTTSSSTPKSSSASTSTPSGSNNTTNQPKKTSEDLTGKLGKDGKLTTEERNRRLTNNLCLFCGVAGHRASECRKAAKARSAKTSEITDTKPAPDSKK